MNESSDRNLLCLNKDEQRCESITLYSPIGSVSVTLYGLCARAGLMCN
jgi:hypothetical protein